MHFKATDPTVGIDTAVVAQHRVAVRGTHVARDFAVPPTLAGMQMLTRRLAEHAPALVVAEPTGGRPEPPPNPGCLCVCQAAPSLGWLACCRRRSSVIMRRQMRPAILRFRQRMASLWVLPSAILRR